MLFSEIIGHNAVKQLLIGSAMEAKVSHALLFSSLEGSGVLPMALAFAQYLNCENPGVSDSCGNCGSCRRASKMEHPDIHYSYPVITTSEIKQPKSIDFVSKWRTAVLSNPYLSLTKWLETINEGELKSKQGIIPVEEANDIIRKISLKAFEGKYKVVIMWLPEKMNGATANKLLKSLEEPPDYTVFILATEQRDLLLPTILSRTQLIRFNKLKEADIIQALVETEAVDFNRARDIAFLSDGNYAEALQILKEDAQNIYGELNFLTWMRLCYDATKNIERLIAWSDEMALQSKEQQKLFLLSCIKMVRECILLNVGVNDLSRLDGAQQESLARFSLFLNAENALEIMSKLDQSCYHIERNASAKILFLDLSLKINRILQKKVVRKVSK